MSTTNEIFDKISNFSANDSTTQNSAKMRPSEKLLFDIKSWGFDMTQLEKVLTTKGNQLIVSCAGSGKTTSIIFKIIYDLKSGRSTVVRDINNNAVRVPDSIWVATFLKSGADELKSAYRKWCNKLKCSDMSQVMHFSTLHAEFKRALNAMGLQTDIISEKDNKVLLKKVLNTFGIRSSRGVKLNEEEVSSLMSALTYTRNRLDATRYETDIYNELGLVGSIIDAILRDWKAQRIIKDKVDFEDLQEILYDAIYVKKDKNVIDFLLNRYNYIYIDEFQDTSQIQYAILKTYCFQAKQVVAIGDDDQTIYSWRGSDNNIITSEFMNDFSPIKNDLSTNFRCPSNILDAIKPSIKKNEKRFSKELKSAVKGGIVRYGEFSGYRQMSTTLADLVYEDVKCNRSVAILCRVNSDGLLPAMFFDKMDNFPFSVSGANMTFDSYIGRLAFSIIKLFTDTFSPDVKRALNLLTWDSYGITALIDVCRTNKESIWTISEEDLCYSCQEVANRILSWRDVRKNSGDIVALKLVLQDYRCNVFSKDTQFNDVMRSVLYGVESLLDYYDYDSVEDFLAELSDMNNRLKAREKKSNAIVKIATVHEFKGKEADSVYIWNDSEDVFPYKKSCGSDAEYEEERRVHYIACTRAKQISTLMYQKNKKGAFVREMDLSNAEKIEGSTSGVLKKTLSKEQETSNAFKKFRESYLDSLDDDLDFSNTDMNDTEVKSEGVPDEIGEYDGRLLEDGLIEDSWFPID